MSSHPPDHQDSRHPTFKQYVLIAIILFAITLVEFLIIVPQSMKGAGVTLAPLFILSAIKFVIVVMFYMHLKFESRTLSIVFATGLALAFLAGGSLLAIFGSLKPTPRDFAAANAVPFIHGAEAGGNTEEPAVSPPVTLEPEAGATEPAGGGSELVAQGEALFTGGNCSTCHTIDGKTSGMVGPDLTRIGIDGADRQPGVSAGDYITESIESPEAFVATGVERAIPGIMTKPLTANLSPAEVEALVAFLSAQK